MKKLKWWLFLSVGLIVFMGLTGCSSFVSQQSGRHEISSSLVDFLYPGKSSEIPQKGGVPVLQLPIKVGLAFVPSSNWRGSDISEMNQAQLLNKVKASFGKQRFIESITIIPSVYLRKPRGNSGFDTLDQLAKLHNIDVIALVSYDQVTQSLHNNASLLYWTIVGMYVIPGNENSIQTFVDTAVFDISSHKLLMRAPGISQLHKRSTAIGVDSVMQAKSMRGFNLAFDDMIKNLDSELSRFRARVKAGKGASVARIQYRPGYNAGGSMSGSFLILLLLLIACISRIRMITASRLH